MVVPESEMVLLGDVFNLQMGKTPAREKNEYWNNGDNPWVSIADLSSYDKYVAETKETISDLGVNKSGIKLIPPNTVLMSFKLSLGKTAITRHEIYTNEAIMAFIPNGTKDVDVDYLYHLFSNKDWTKGTNRAVMGSTLNKATLSNIEIPLPPLDEQKRIADVLDKASELIKKRKEQIRLMDELAKSLFIEMFGDPVENPMGWERDSLRHLAIRISDGPFGSNLKSCHYTNSGVRVIRLQNIGVGIFLDEDKAFVSYEHYEKIKKYTCTSGDVIIATLGDPNLRACILHIDLAINKADCVLFRPNKMLVNSDFICSYLNCPSTLQLVLDKIHGQTRLRISMSQVADLSVYLPPISLQNEFADRITIIEQQKALLQDGLAKMETAYKALMQEYFG